MIRDTLDKPSVRSEKHLPTRRKVSPSTAGGKTAVIPMLPVRPPATGIRGGNRWGVILAGGDGTRLRPLTRLISGDDRPKQFCPLFGTNTLLEQTLRRSERTIPRERLLVSVTAQHAAWYVQQSGLSASQRVVQPSNKGTAPAILHGLLSIAGLDSRAVVAVLPCDHHYSDEASFHFALESAFQVATAHHELVVLLGARPDYPEVEYGWIELGSPLESEDRDLFKAKAFREKPVIDIARRLFEHGAIWNTFVMVGHVQAFLKMIEATLPELLRSVSSARFWSGQETNIEDSIYERLPAVSFSHCVLAAQADTLAVLRLNDLVWSDLGDPGRAVLAAHDCGCEVPWLHAWKLANPGLSLRETHQSCRKFTRTSPAKAPRNASPTIPLAESVDS